MSFGTAYATKKRGQKCMAKGGFVKEEEASGMDEKPEAMDKDNEAAMEEDADMIARIMHKRRKYAEGGEAGGDEPEGNDAIALPKFSEGGKVANDVGVSEADELPAEYDDLVLRDDLEDEAPAGNEHGDEHQYKRDMDVVAKIMSSRKKKDKMPRPA